ncbi:MAG: oligosaccharide flippase family protein [FCB group bacterium]|nr:oligosaccharide flippase family protein [FCB group bacterium]MBL7027276.1 oligosaccharide flippase family protein [Candidatus Neomarinimicrobiota bacterium]MBL7122246.1 oligosaccharide flippase family protein [Candidatus Neomarinimicrobiota bacterium]
MSKAASSIKQLSKHTLVYGIGNILNRGMTFLLLPFYTNLISTEDYGVYSLVYSFIALTNVFFIHGMDTAFMRFFIPEKDENKRKQILNTVYTSIFISTFLLTAGIYLVLPTFSSGLISIPPNSVMLLYLSLIILFDALAFLPIVYYRAVNKPVNYVLIVFVEVVINLSLNIYFVAFQKMGLEGILLSNAISSLAKFLLSSPVLWQYFRFRWDRQIWKDILKYGLPTVPAVFFLILISVSDRFLLKHYLGAHDVGLYASGYKIGVVMALLITAFRFAWQPFYLSRGEDPDAPYIFARIFTLFVAVTGFIYLGVSIVLVELLKLPYGDIYIIATEYHPGLKVVPFILLGNMLFGLSQNFIVGAYIKKKTLYIPLFTGIGFLVNISANILFLSVLKWGFLSAGYALVLTYIVQGLVIYFTVRRFYPVPYNFGKMAKNFIVIALLFFIPMLLENQYLLVNLALVIIYFPLLDLVGVLSLKQIRRELFKH